MIEHKDAKGNRVSYPPIYSVHIDDQGLKNANARAFLSNFSVPSDVPLSAEDSEGNRVHLRGIANIGFSFPQNQFASPVKLRVYVTLDEKNVFAWKYIDPSGPEWVLIGGGPLISDVMGPYIGYFEIKFPIGDPPIAVG